MRIIAGQWRGRRLKAPSGDLVRPTTDRTKEALFNILGPSVGGAVVLDLCCGAGGLGLEALSRGAAQVVFVDQSRPSLEATRDNLVLCGAPAATYRLEAGDALGWLGRWGGCGGSPWILICDPPYQSETAGAMIKLLSSADLPAGFGCAVVEYGRRTPDIPHLAAGWQERRYGKSHLAIYRPGAETPQQESKL